MAAPFIDGWPARGLGTTTRGFIEQPTEDLASALGKPDHASQNQPSHHRESKGQRGNHPLRPRLDTAEALAIVIVLSQITAFFATVLVTNEGMVEANPLGFSLTSITVREGILSTCLLGVFWFLKGHHRVVILAPLAGVLVADAVNDIVLALGGSIYFQLEAVAAAGVIVPTFALLHFVRRFASAKSSFSA